MTISEMKRLLRKNGCYCVKSLKGHDDWYSPITGRHFLLPRHPSKELGTGLTEAIKKQAGLK